MSSPVLGYPKDGVPISREVAIELRQLVFGTAAAPPRGEWPRSAFLFNAPNQNLAYGLRCPRNGTMGLNCVLQGFILKHLLFNKRATGRKHSLEEMLRPSIHQQNEALLAAMAEILMIIAEKAAVTIVLPGDKAYIPHSVSYFQDTVTEKLHLYEMRKPDEINAFLRKHISCFTEDPGPGALLFLYSAVFTRTLPKYYQDKKNLLTIGISASPQYGVLNRSSIGMLLWETDKNNFSGRQPGSRLKTPSLPIWITLCGTHFGVLFNTNPDLLRNYHAESRFDLHYYNCSGSHLSLTVDNRHQHEKANFMLQRQSSSSNNESGGSASGSGGGGGASGHQSMQQREDGGTTPIEKLVQTKWEEARIRCHSQPITLSYLFNATS